MAAFRDWFLKELKRIGWRELLRQADGEFTGGAVQGWLRGSLPTPLHQIALAKIIGTSVESVRDLVWETEKARDETKEEQRAASRAPFRARSQAPWTQRRPKRTDGGAVAVPLPPEGSERLDKGRIGQVTIRPRARRRRTAGRAAGLRDSVKLAA